MKPSPSVTTSKVRELATNKVKNTANPMFANWHVRHIHSAVLFRTRTPTVLGQYFATNAKTASGIPLTMTNRNAIAAKTSTGPMSRDQSARSRSASGVAGRPAMPIPSAIASWSTAGSRRPTNTAATTIAQIAERMSSLRKLSILDLDEGRGIGFGH